jgi:hypothetical protein
MMQLQAVDTVDAIVVAPLLAGAIGAGDHQPVQDGEEDRALDGKLEAAISQKFMQHLAAAAVIGPMRLQLSAGTLPSSIRDRIIER